MISKFTKLFIALLAVASGFGANAQQVCSQFAYFYSDINYPNGQKQSDIYSVALGEGEAVLTPIVENLTYGAHIAFNEADGLLYLVNDANGEIRSIDPSTGEEAAIYAAPSNLSGITTAAFSEDGKLFMGRSNGEIISTQLLASPYAIDDIGSNANVSGGDMTFINDNLLLAAKPNGAVNQVLGGTNYFMLNGFVTGEVTGMATLQNDAGLIVSGNGNSAFLVYDVSDDEVSEAGSYAAMLDGEAFTLENGDMASGCASFTSIGGDCGYELYYAHQPQGSGYSLNRVTFNNDGSANVIELLPSIIGGHIGLTPDGSKIYSVGGNRVVTYDAATGAILENKLITNAAGQTLSGFPAAVVGDDGTFYAGDDSGNQVYIVDPLTGDATPYGESVNVSGGDLIFVDGEMWVISRGPDKFFKVRMSPEEEQVSFSVPVTEMNGAAVLADGRVIVADGTNDDLFKIIDISDLDNIQVEDVVAMIPLFNGDFAGRCLDNPSPNPTILPSDCVGFEILDFNQGLQTNGMMVSADRRIEGNEANVLGAPNKLNDPGSFVSLGDGGSITLGFNGIVLDGPGADIRIFETSFSGDVCGASDDESALIELSQDGFNYVSAGIICRDGEVDMTPLGLEYVSSIRITSIEGTTLDGYDVDGVESIHGCNDFPLLIPGDCYATDVVAYERGSSFGGGSIANNRAIPMMATGEPERIDELVFVSLGYDRPETPEVQEGVLILSFDGIVPNLDGPDLEIVETTYGNSSCDSYLEFADVYVSVDNVNYSFAKTVCRADGFVDISDAGVFSYINYVKIVSNGAMSNTPDGFDVDGVVAIHNCELPEGDEDEEPIVQIDGAQSVLETYPNPSTGPAFIEFTVPTSGRTTLEVMDMNGRLVEMLFNQEAQAGNEYRFEFNGTALPNGIYITKLTTETEMVIEKLMIAK